MEQVPQDVGLSPSVPYDYLSVVGPGSLVFTAGACPLDEDGSVVGLDDVVVQASRCVDNLRRALGLRHATLDDVVRTTIYVVGARESLVAAWGVIADAFAPKRPPSTLVGVHALGYEHQLVEIDAIASMTTPSQ